jgi:hypothetical protein
MLPNVICDKNAGRFALLSVSKILKWTYAGQSTELGLAEPSWLG